MLENCHEWVFLPEWFILIYQTNKSILCPLYSIKVTFLLRKGTLPKNSCWQKSPTHIYPLEPAEWIILFLYWVLSLPKRSHLAWLQRLLLHTHNIFISLLSMHTVAVTYLPYNFPSSAIFKKHKEKDTPYKFLNQKASLHQISPLPQLRAQCIQF